MTLVIPQDFAHVIHSLRWSPDPEPMAITYGISIDTGTPPATVTALADAIDNAFETALLPGLSVNIERIQTEVRWQQNPLPSAPVVGVHVETDAGGRAGANMVPQNTAFLVHKRGPVGGNGGRGRFYIPGVGEAEVDNVGNIGSPTLTIVQNACDAFMTALAAASGVNEMVILHDSAGAHAGDLPAPVDTLTVDPLIATQRRRLRR